MLTFVKIFDPTSKKILLYVLEQMDGWIKTKYGIIKKRGIKHEWN